MARYDALSRPTVKAMKRRSKAGGKPAKARPRKALTVKGRNAPKAVFRLGSASAGRTEIARLSHELNEALEQHAATAEVLKVISRSTFHLQTVLDTLAESAARLCGAERAFIFRPKDGSFHFAAGYGYSQEFRKFLAQAPLPLGRGSIVGRAALEKKVVQIKDTKADPEFAFVRPPNLRPSRSMLGVPLIRDGTLIGVMGFARAVLKSFNAKEIELATTFANQAIIAIENARLLTELRKRTADLTESLEQQTATSDVLKVISSSPGDLEPVFATMLEKAVQICDATFGNIYRWDGEALQLVATHNTPPAYAQHRRHSPFRAEQDNAVARMIRSKAVVHVFDAATNETYTQRRDMTVVAAVELGGIRSSLVVPMLKEEELVGAFIVSRQEVRAFTDKQIALVTNFAAQAVIAIENARLLSELRQRTDELQRSYEVVQQQASQLETQAQRLEQRVTDQVGEIERMSRLRRFLPPQVADLIVASGTEKQLESHRREITALFCDLRGFTAFTEIEDAEDVMTLLCEYHAAIGEIIVRYGGTLERYAGDGVMVIFNDPIPVDNPALQAVQMALEMREAIGALTEKWRQLGHEIGFGIGIAHGYATLGTIGFEGRFDYAAIGTVSNVASRLCDEAKPGQILISRRVLMAVKNAVTIEPVGEFELKGIRRPIAAYNVLAASLPSP
jgi:class 3 adenylate cyclase/putative methionine-R-sulfoxide reductase with GAF domain